MIVGIVLLLIAIVVVSIYWMITKCADIRKIHELKIKIDSIQHERNELIAQLESQKDRTNKK